MKTFSSAHLTDAKKNASERRYRNILANSGELMESNEVRDVEHFYVMGRDSKLIPISKLAKNPDQQAQEYSLNFAKNHGHYDPVTGERVVETDDIIGDARVWLEDDGLHARVYFANNDSAADHCWAISDNASYSIGADHYPDGYDGAGNVIDEPIAILREISMVDTGNDPRAVTIDTISGKGASGAAAGDNKTIKKGTTMGKTIDQLTPDERRALGEKLLADLDDFTTNAPESETEPTARDNKDNDTQETTDNVETEEDGATEPTATRKSNDRAAHQTVRVIRQHDEVRQERAVSTKDFRFSSEARRKFADMAYQHGGFKNGFVNQWHDYLRSKKATINDGITGLGLPVDVKSLFIDALEKSDGIISHFDHIGGNAFRVRLLTALDGNDSETARAGGFKKGDKKLLQELLATPRTVYNKMVYKMLDIDALELHENPDLIEVRARELVQAIIVEVERAATIGDGRTAPTAEGAADRRMFDGTRGFYSILADAQATEGFGQLMATSITLPAGSNLYDASIEAESEIDAEGGLVYITKKSVVKALRQAKKSADSNEPLIAPGTRITDLLDAEEVYTPAWMVNAPVDVIVFANKSYGLTGERAADMRPEFKTETNQNVLLAEQPRGGSLKAYKAAAVITFATASDDDGGDTPSTQSASSKK